MRRQKLIIVVGPTGSGKTALAIKLAKQLDGEVISADSRQVYRGLDVGTVKVTKREMRGIPHHLIDVVSPRRAGRATTAFSTADFVRLADSAIADIVSRGKVPIIAGGTGYYVDALLGRIAVPDVAPNPKLREKLEGLQAKALYEKLRKLDPRRARTIEKNNPRRLIRAIEIAIALGNVPVQRKNKAARYDAVLIGLCLPPTVFDKKIRTRTERFRNQHTWRKLLAELALLKKARVSKKNIATLGFEYALALRYVEGTLKRKDFYAALVSLHKKYAKRQLRYLKRNPDIQWVCTPSLQSVRSVLQMYSNNST